MGVAAGLQRDCITGAWASAIASGARRYRPDSCSNARVYWKVSPPAPCARTTGQRLGRPAVPQGHLTPPSVVG
jgi:hypothetical protein